MRSASRQARRSVVVAMIVVAAATICVSLPAVSANEPNDLRVVSMTRSGGQLTVVVSVPKYFLAVASAPGGLTVEGPSGEALAPTVTTLTPADTAVAIVVHNAGATPEGAARASGTAGELIRSLDPAIAVTLVTTTGGAVMMPLTTDRSAALAALAQPVADAPVALTAALAAAAGPLAGGHYVDPMVIVVDAGAMDDPGTTTLGDVPSAPGMGVRIIPVAATPSPMAAQLARRLGLVVPAGTDPVALVDDAVGLLTGRLSVSVADPGAGTVTIRVRGEGADLAVPITLSPPTVATTAAEPIATTTTVPVVLAERSTPSATVAVPVAPPAVPAAVPAASSGSSWMVLLGGVVAVAVVGVGGGVALVGRRRRSTAKGPGPPPVPTDADAPVTAPATFRYTDLSSPLPSSRVKARPRRAVVPRIPPPPPPAVAIPPKRQAEVAPAAVEQPAVPPEPEVAPEAAPPAPEPVVAAPVAPALGASNDSAMSSSQATEAYARRVRVLALAEELGNVSEACRIVGVSRRSFYEWKRIADEHGNEALYPKRSR